MIIHDKKLFRLLSFTWGLPMTFVGCVAAMILTAMGHKPKKWGHCYYFEVGHGWGGIELGAFFIVNKNPSEYIRNHELGHGFQNCLLGPLMPFVVSIPSAIRYWNRKRLVKSGKKEPQELPNYDSAWFEGSATSLGTEFMNWYNTQQND